MIASSIVRKVVLLNTESELNLIQRGYLVTSFKDMPEEKLTSKRITSPICKF